MWATRRHLWVDRVASAWLIQRFIDPHARFVWLDNLADCPPDIRGADTSRLDLTPQSSGLYAISLGLSDMFSDDHDMLEHGLVMYDALYAWCRHCQAEGHAWPPKMAE
ncbi:chromate resistance protein [Burkholderia cenocepacia]|nr:chromate resistance protein [Burkholderia cenocepacia]